MMRARRDPDREQVETRIVRAEEIVGDPSFAAGVSDLRAGARPRFDEMNDWNYERGRQWAAWRSSRSRSLSSWFQPSGCGLVVPE